MDTQRLIIRRLREHVAELASFTEGLGDEELRRPPPEGGWSLHELALHMVEVQDLFSERIAGMLGEDSPPMAPFPPDTARTTGYYLTRNLAEGLRSFRQQRATLLVLLESLTERQWQREGRHPEIRHYTVERCMESLMRHEEHHLYRMFNVFFGAQR